MLKPTQYLSCRHKHIASTAWEKTNVNFLALCNTCITTQCRCRFSHKDIFMKHKSWRLLLFKIADTFVLRECTPGFKNK